MYSELTTFLQRLFTYNSGKFLEGLEILVDLTDDEGYRSLAANVANSAMKTGAWNRA